MFPYIQKRLHEHGISSYSYNFSHGGIEGNLDYFTELDLYEKNCMRFETQDLCEIVRHLKDSPIEYSPKNKLFFFAHSMGAVPAIFTAKKIIGEGHEIDGIILISGVSTLNLWSGRITDEWEKTGVCYAKNNRTKQELPQGREFLEEIKQAGGKWNVQKALKNISTNFLIIHGENDEAVPGEHAINLNEWNIQFGHNTTLKIIPGATHTYNTKHPFEGPSKELDQMIGVAVGWINKLQSGNN